MKKTLKTKCILLLVVIMTVALLSGCGGDAESNGKSPYSYEEDSMFYEEMKYLYKYVEQYDIPLPKYTERTKVANALTQSNYDNKWANMIYVDKVPAFFKEDSYTGTVEQTNYMYWGELNKDDRPDGIGVLYQYYDGLSYYDPQLLVLYMGEFSDGFYDGYGVEFEIPEQNNDISMMYYSAMNEENIFLFNDPIYEGYFEEGRRSGIGTEILWNYAAIDIYTGEQQMNPDEADFVLYIGDFEKDKLKGNVSLYDHKGVLEYEGEFKNGDFNGEGKYYYIDYPGQLMYEGEFGGGNFYGKGTLYDEKGKIIKKGEFNDVSPYEFLLTHRADSNSSVIESDAEILSENDSATDEVLVEEIEEDDEGVNNLEDGSETFMAIEGANEYLRGIVDSVINNANTYGAEIISVNYNEEYEIFDCNLEFVFLRGAVGVNLVLDKEYNALNCDIESSFDGAFDERIYEEFRSVVGVVSHRIEETMWDEVNSIIDFEMEVGKGSREMASNICNTYYMFNYDTIEDNYLKLNINFPFG